MQLVKRLEEWVKAGLITEDQRSAITEFETNRPSRSHYGFIALGVVAIATGIVSLIAFNWERIPGWLKLVNNGILLVSASGAIIYFKLRQKQLPFEGLLLFLFLLVGATIGLISQVFHTSGEYYEALLLWSLLTSAMVLFSGSRVTIHLWILLSVAATLSFLFEKEFIDEITVIYYYLLLLPLFLLLLASLLGNRFFPLILPVASALRFWAIMLLFPGLVMASIPESFTDIGHDLTQFSTVYTRFALFLALAIALTSYFVSGKKPFSALFAGLSLGSMYTLVRYRIYAMGSGNIEIMNGVLPGLLFIAVVLFFAFYAVSEGHSRLFDLSIVIIGIRVVIFYFQVFGDLASTGIGLIVSGILVILLTILYIKKRRTILYYIESFTSKKSGVTLPIRQWGRVSTVLLTVSLALPILFFFTTEAKLALASRQGVKVILPVHGYDPRDLLAGHYLRYTVDYPDSSTQNVCQTLEFDPEESQDANQICFCISNYQDEKTYDGYFLPSCEESNRRDCVAYLKWECRHGRFMAGIERYYIPEKKADLMDQDLRSQGGCIRVAAPSSGQAQVLDFYPGNNAICKALP